MDLGDEPPDAEPHQNTLSQTHSRALALSERIAHSPAERDAQRSADEEPNAAAVPGRVLRRGWPADPHAH